MMLRVLKVIIGIVLMIVGVALMLVPGPGVPVFAVGLGLVLSQSEPGRRQLARLRLAARRRFNPDRVRAVEKRLPKEVVEENTTELRLNLEEYAARRHREKRRGRRD